MEYRYKLSHAFITIASYLILLFCGLVYTIWIGYIAIIKLAVVISIALVVFTIYYQIKFDRMFNANTDLDKLIISICKGWVSEEISMKWEDITRISCYRKYIIFKKLYISTRYKSVTLNIRNFKNYKEMLKKIIEKTENNKNIRIDQAIYEMIQ